MPETTRFVLAHGFTQTARSWRPFERALQQRIASAETVAVDLPGHGDAAVPPASGLWESASHLVSVGGRGTYIGYSMGGRVSLHAALAHPDAVRSLVLVGATAGIDDHDERAERRAADERLAERLESIGVEAFVDDWLANPLFAGLDATTSLRTDRLRNTAAGLAASLRATGTGVQEPLWSRLGEIGVPALVMAGEYDEKFRALGVRLAAALPQATFVVIEGAGHSVHLEQPDATAEAVARWYVQTRP
jgi:2-succinyl-6-hydroxy-2,4-cyclohexadiene-1-carboxylate synthase